jgi:hypothetical protein
MWVRGSRRYRCPLKYVALEQTCGDVPTQCGQGLRLNDPAANRLCLLQVIEDFVGIERNVPNIGGAERAELLVVIPLVDRTSSEEFLEDIKNPDYWCGF